MTWSEFYKIALDWKIAVGSILGFVGLAGAALLNAHLNRRRDDRIRKGEAKALALALGQEIRINAQAIYDEYRTIRMLYPDNFDFGLLYLLSDDLNKREIISSNFTNISKIE
jgi:hypothetical protein